MDNKFLNKLLNDKLGIYMSISIFATLIDYSIFWVLVAIIKFHYLLSNSISLSLGIITKFSLNRKFTFKERRILTFSQQFIRFLTVSGSGFLLSNLFLFIVIDYYSINELIAKVFAIGIVFVYTFILHNLYSFQK